jgi:hypothetical protein
MKRTNFTCSMLISSFILSCSASYTSLSGLPASEDGTGAELLVASPDIRIKLTVYGASRGVSNACLDSVATLIAVTPAPGSPLFPNEESLCKHFQHRDPWNYCDDNIKNLPHWNCCIVGEELRRYPINSWGLRVFRDYRGERDGTLNRPPNIQNHQCIPSHHHEQEPCHNQVLATRFE